MRSAAGFSGHVAVFVKGLWLTVVLGRMGEWGGGGFWRFEMVMVTPDPVPEEPGGAPVPVEEPTEEEPGEPEEEAA
jgi:hypothetical protein